jgi:hypothetical protein
MRTLLIRSVIFWFLFLPLAVLNGAIRQYLYMPIMSELRAHQLSTLTAALLFLGLGYLMLKNQILFTSPASLFISGALLLFLTLLFEFGFFHYVGKYPWEKLLADYNLAGGRVWSLFLIWIAATPWIIKFLIKK